MGLASLRNILYTIQTCKLCINFKVEHCKQFHCEKGNEEQLNVIWCYHKWLFNDREKKVSSAQINPRDLKVKDSEAKSPTVKIKEMIQSLRNELAKDFERKKKWKELTLCFSVGSASCHYLTTKLLDFPTKHFTILDPRNPSMVEFNFIRKLQSIDFEVLQLINVPFCCSCRIDDII